MARNDSSRTRYGRDPRGQDEFGRYDQGRVNPNREPGIEHNYGYNGEGQDEPDEFERDRQRQPPPMSGSYGSESQQFRPSWPEQRGSYGEREYGQRDQSMYDERARGYGRMGPRGGYPQRMPPGFREQVYSWPVESMGTGTNLPYYGSAQYGASPYGGAYPRQWGGMVGFGAGQPGTPYWETHPYGGEYMDAAELEAMQGSGRVQAPMPRPSYSGRGPKGYKRTDDRIHEEICEKLTKDPWIDASHIEVSVKDQEVTLEGHVHERRVKHMVEDAVASVSGVREIHNSLKVERHDAMRDDGMLDDGENRETRVAPRGRSSGKV
jgi:hypothetical protein